MKIHFTSFEFRKIFLGSIFFSIFFLALFLRFYNLGNYPKALYTDEVAIGVNAYSILKTGKDEYGKSFPLAFRSFNDYKLPGYVYATTLSEAIFGKTDFAVRFPSAFFGSLTVLSFMGLLFLLTRNTFISSIGGLFLATSPWHVHFSRAAFESNMSLFFLVTGTVFILFGIKKKSFISVVGILFYVISLYTYHAPRIFVPFFFFVLLLLYKKTFLEFWKKKKSAVLLTIIAVVILLIPFIQYAFSPGGLSRARSESFLRDVKINKHTQKLEAVYLMTNRFLENYVSYFSLGFLFSHGDYNGRHSVREIGEMYIWQLPFLVYGLYQGVKRKNEADKIFLAWLFIAPITPSLASPNPHALRALSFVIPLIYFTSQGLFSFFIKYRRRFAKVGISLFLFYFLYQYLHIYYVHYPKRVGPDWSEGYRETVQYILQHEEEYSEIVMTSHFSKAYMYFFFYSDWNPELLQSFANPDLSFGKYRFTHVSYTNTTPGKILYVARELEEPIGKHLKTIKNSGNDVIFKLWEI